MPPPVSRRKLTKIWEIFWCFSSFFFWNFRQSRWFNWLNGKLRRRNSFTLLHIVSVWMFTLFFYRVMAPSMICDAVFCVGGGLFLATYSIISSFLNLTDHELYYFSTPCSPMKIYRKKSYTRAYWNRRNLPPTDNYSLDYEPDFYLIIKMCILYFSHLHDSKTGKYLWTRSIKSEDKFN